MPNIEENENEKALLRKALLEKIGSLTGSCEAAAGFSSDSEKAHDCARKRRTCRFQSQYATAASVIARDWMMPTKRVDEMYS